MNIKKKQPLHSWIFCKSVPRHNSTYLKINGHMVCKNCAKNLQSPTPCEDNKKIDIMNSTPVMTLEPQRLHSYPYNKKFNASHFPYTHQNVVSSENSPPASSLPDGTKKLNRRVDSKHITNSESIKKRYCTVASNAGQIRQTIPERRQPLQAVPKCRQLGMCTNNANSYNRVEERTRKDSEECFTNRRPIKCPISECECMVAMSLILNHFSRKHPQIAFLPINPDSTTPLAININAIPYNEMNCTALLLSKERQRAYYSANNETNAVNARMESLKSYKNFLPLPLMICKMRSKKVTPQEKLTSSQLPVSEDTLPKFNAFILPKTKGILKSESFSQPSNQFPNEMRWNTVNEQNHSNSESTDPNKENNFCDTDFVLMWLSSLESKCFYTITAFDTVTKEQFAYKGACCTLNDKQSGDFIFNDLDCMILHQSVPQDVSNNAPRIIELKVTVGKSDIQT